VITSKLSPLYSSILVQITLAFFTHKLSSISFTATVFFFTESIQINSISGHEIAIGINGNHHPVHTSTTLIQGFRIQVSNIFKESLICLIRTHSSSRIAERFNSEFFFKKTSINIFQSISITS
jgi:hypothetical protein